jgi:tetratricopeptide (TPR) repeat protein
MMRSLLLAVAFAAVSVPASAQIAGIPDTPPGEDRSKSLTDPTELAEAAYLSFLAEDFKDADLSARLALKADERSALANAVLGNVLAVRGTFEGDRGKIADARDAIDKSLARDPRLALAHNALGVALAGEGKLADAQAAFNKAIALDETLGVAYGNLGWVQAQQKRYEDAERSYKLALKLDPERAIPYNGLAAVQGSQGRYEEMEKSCRDAIRRWQPADRILGSFYANLAVALFEQREPDEARRAVAKAKALGVARHPAYRIIEASQKP